LTNNYNAYNNLVKFPFRFGACAILALTILFLICFRKYDLSPNVAEWGQFGDYFGGILNPIFGLISTVLVAAALRSQTRAASRQAFENQFFIMLELHSSILGSIDRKTKNTVERRGRDCFRLFYNKIVRISQSEHVPMATAYQKFLEVDGWEIEHYFRTVYHIFKHVKDGHRSIDATDEERKKYYDLIKSQLSQYELVLLWLNVQSINKGNWQSILDDQLAKPFEHLHKAHLIENPRPLTAEESEE
jgi:hypothetical protein